MSIKYIKVRGVKIPVKKWNNFLKKIKKIDKDEGTQISPKLFSILIDKLLGKKNKRRVTVPKPKKNPIIGDLGISATLDPKSDIAIEHALIHEQRLQKIIGNLKEPKKNDVIKIEQEKPKLIEEKKNDEIVLYNGPKKITITEDQYNNFMNHHQNIVQNKENEKKMTSKELKDYKLKVDLDRIREHAGKYADKETKYDILRKYIKLKNEDLKENDRIKIKGTSEALLAKIDEKFGIDLYGSIYDNYVNTEWKKLHPNTPLPQEPIIEEVKEEKDNKEPIILSPRHAPATPQKLAAASQGGSGLVDDIKRKTLLFIKKYGHGAALKLFEVLVGQATPLSMDDHRQLDSWFRGQGANNKMAPDGLDNFQIDKIMKNYPQYLGCIAHDQIKSLIIPKIKPRSIGCFVINTDPASKGGQHWQAVYFDGKKDFEIDFYDSFGDSPDKTIMKGVKEIADKLDCDTYLKFKQNCIKQQDDRTANCGFFCVKFLIDRINGKHFTKASGFDDHIVNAARKGEKEINNFKHQMGYGAWSYIKSFAKKAVNVGKEIVDRVKLAATGRTDAPPAVRNLLSKYGNETITSITIAREPVNRIVTGILNAVSQGKLEENRKALGYDDIYHLYMIIGLSGGHKFRIDRNEALHVSAPNVPAGAQTMDVPVNKQVTLNDFFSNAAAGNADFWRYNPTTCNCQMFVRDSLSKSGLLSGKADSFILQDAESLLSDSPIAKKFAEKVTDFASRLHILIHGRNKYKRRIKRNYKN